ncbi:putative linoleate 9S-lipoxygenase [Rosa chinensis]|uniref:Putative linoleate 9S-lipoxygenase n=1 Tax=Rosa chinensis TaxID=74649 RepID=A0A2P6Q0J7_ROSCH|nr:putative linoleate 9S-lipoxygenase [Rosa chinensis]
MFQTHGSNKKIKGTVVLMKKNFFYFNDFNASVLARVKEFWGRRVSLQLISAVMVILTYIPSDTPLALRKYRQQELEQLRGNGTGELNEWERVYDYAYYNDLGDPDSGSNYARPVLGGTSQYPYCHGHVLE